ncbi:MAG: arginine--tRNA ligase [Nitrospirae bacterium]|nr:arginine--tRNA ligase [Nitrospirota bacterium]
MKEALSNILYNALKEAKEKTELKIKDEPLIILEIPKDETKGDIATTVAMALAASEKKKPRYIAEIIVKHIKDEAGIIEKVDIAGPGFINFFLKDEYYHQVLKQIDKEEKDYGKLDIGKGEKVQVEFVSANPTGPLHVGHGRGAAVGDALSNLLAATGYDVTREFYINDAGRQVRLLAQSVYSRYRQMHGKDESFPEDGYHGTYINEVAASATASQAISLKFVDVPFEKCEADFAEFSKEEMLRDIRNDLNAFGVRFDNWFSERSLLDDSSVQKSIEELKEHGFVYEKDDAIWLRSTAFGDDKDRVVIKKDGSYTYLATDIAYHRNKLSRGFKKLVNIWGADHHGYIPRVQAVIQAFGEPKETLHILLVQLVAVLRQGKPVPMSKRAGDFVTLREVIQDVGSDAARFFFLMRRSDSHLDFDLELAKKQSSENPVYYVQYAHARLCSVERQAEENKSYKTYKTYSSDSVDFGLLKLPEEKNIMKQLALYPITIEGAAMALEPHRITFYLQNLAGLLHNYYFHHRIITDDKPLTDARLVLMKGVRQVIKNALGILGVSAPEKM